MMTKTVKLARAHTRTRAHTHTQKPSSGNVVGGVITKSGVKLHTFVKAHFEIVSM